MTMGLVAEFSFCVPCAARNNVTYGLIFHTVHDYSSQNRDRLSQDILILKGTKHQLSVYDKIPMIYVFSLMPVLHFSSFPGPLQHGFEK